MIESPFRVVGDVEESGEIVLPLSARNEFPENPTPPHLSDTWPSILWTLGVLGAVGCASFFLDLNVSWSLNQRQILKPIHRTLELAEPFGDFAGVILVALGIAVLQPSARRHLPLLVLAVATAGLTADLFKMCVGRIRPTNLDWSVVRSVGDTFTEWFPSLRGGWKNQSFPSAHTATAWALAILLVRLLPRGRWFFPGIAACVALQRVETGSHYLSDAVFGAMIGIGVACTWLRTPLFRDFLPLNAGNSRKTEGEPVNDDQQDFQGESSVG